jgi:hypothetical protein
MLHDTLQFEVIPMAESDFDLLGIAQDPGDEVLLHIIKYVGE